jgi:hypothetical protein
MIPIKGETFPQIWERIDPLFWHRNWSCHGFHIGAGWRDFGAIQ